MNQKEFKTKSNLLLLIARSYVEGDRIRAYAPKTKSRHHTKSDGKRASRALREATPGLVRLASTPVPGEYRIDPFGKARLTQERVTLRPSPPPSPGRYRLPSQSSIPKQVKL